MPRFPAVLLAFGLGLYRDDIFPVWRWDTPSTWPMNLLGVVFLYWLTKDQTS